MKVAASGLIPQFPGGLDSTVLLLIIAIVGTTVAPWQLFFQQSNMVDKRITATLDPLCASRFDDRNRRGHCRGDGADGGDRIRSGRNRRDIGNFTDAGAVATGLGHHLGNTVAVLFAIILLDASLIGANAIGLATTYAIGDAMGKRHSLHWKISDAPWFYGGYALLLAVSAAVVVQPRPHPRSGDPRRAGACRHPVALGDRVSGAALQ